MTRVRVCVCVCVHERERERERERECVFSITGNRPSCQVVFVSHNSLELGHVRFPHFHLLCTFLSVFSSLTDMFVSGTPLVSETH